MEWSGNAIKGGKFPSFQRSKKFGGSLLAPAPRFMERQEFSLQEGRGGDERALARPRTLAGPRPVSGAAHGSIRGGGDRAREKIRSRRKKSAFSDPSLIPAPDPVRCARHVATIIIVKKKLGLHFGHVSSSSDFDDDDDGGGGGGNSCSD